jgi:hypothetical protein
MCLLVADSGILRTKMSIVEGGQSVVLLRSRRLARLISQLWKLEAERQRSKGIPTTNGTLQGRGGVTQTGESTSTARDSRCAGGDQTDTVYLDMYLMQFTFCLHGALHAIEAWCHLTSHWTAGDVPATVSKARGGRMSETVPGMQNHNGCRTPLSNAMGHCKGPEDEICLQSEVLYLK